MRRPEPLRPLAVSAPDRYLVGDEEALLSVRRHWSTLSRVLGETLGVWFLGIALAGLLPPSPLIDLVGIVMLAALARLVWHVVLWRRTTITVTDKRMFILTGVLTRRLSMMPLRKVTDMTLVNPWPGRLLGYGSIIVESAGQNQAMSEIHHIPHPMDFYRLVAGLVFDGRRSRSRVNETMTLDEL